MNETTEVEAEVAVVGAGFAGLSAALMLGRAQVDVVVIGSGPTRNSEAAHAHNLLTRDGASPSEILDTGTKEVAQLSTVRLLEDHVESVVPEGDGFILKTDGGEMRAKRVLLATGVRDTLPEIDGLADIWGRKAHSCPFCDAAPYAGRPILGIGPEVWVDHMVPILVGWTSDITVVDPADIRLLEDVDGGVRASLTDGTTVTVDGVFVMAQPVIRLDLVADLPLAYRGPYLAVDNDGRTSVPGLWAAGDCAWCEGETFPAGQVVQALAAGSRAAAAIIMERLDIHIPEAPPIEMRGAPAR